MVQWYGKSLYHLVFIYSVVRIWFYDPASIYVQDLEILLFIGTIFIKLPIFVRLQFFNGFSIWFGLILTTKLSWWSLIGNLSNL